MKKNKKKIAVLLGFILVFSIVLGQMPARNRTKASDDGEAGQAASSGAVTSGGAVTAAPSFTPAPTEDPYGISKPVRDNKGVTTTWDCIYFGNYWQNDTDGDGSADKRDKKEPVRWRVLSVYRDSAFIMADQGLDCQPYNTEEDDVTWETSSLRAWLNDTFYQDAFSEAEQAAISTTSVETMEKNPENGANYKNFTQDNVYLLSLTEVANTAYGFDEDFQKESKTRCSKGTEYARKQGALISAHIGSDDYSGNVWWLLRSSTYNTEGLKTHTVALVGGGGGCGYSRGCAVTDHYSAVRPVLHIDLTSDTWSKAGTITSEGESIEPTPSPTPTPVPTASPTPTPTPDGSGSTGGAEATQKPATTEEPIPTSTPPAVNTKQKDSSGITYTVTTSSLSKGEVAYTIPKNKKITSAAIPATVKLDGITYKVTSIKANAFKNCKKLKKVTIGNNIKTIGKSAFYGCAKLRNITIKTTKLTQKNVGNKAFAKIHKQAVFKVPKKKLSAYKKLLKKKGVSGKKQVIKK